jgi:hypothetical protein
MCFETITRAFTPSQSAARRTLQASLAAEEAARKREFGTPAAPAVDNVSPNSSVFVNEATGDATSAEAADTNKRRGRRSVRVRVNRETVAADPSSGGNSGSSLTVPLS